MVTIWDGMSVSVDKGVEWHGAMTSSTGFSTGNVGCQSYGTKSDTWLE